MTTFSDRFLVECLRFARCVGGHSMTARGLEQFYLRESKGVTPDDPDPYFHRLTDGKRWWEWTVNMIAGTYGTDEWQGWAALEHDYRNDPSGIRQIRDRVKRRGVHAQ